MFLTKSGQQFLCWQIATLCCRQCTQCYFRHDLFYRAYLYYFIYEYNSNVLKIILPIYPTSSSFFLVTCMWLLRKLTSVKKSLSTTGSLIDSAKCYISNNGFSHFSFPLIFQKTFQFWDKISTHLYLIMTYLMTYVSLILWYDGWKSLLTLQQSVY